MNEELETLIENFSLFDDWEERYAYLIDLGKKLPAMPDELKHDQYLVRGCTSKVWLFMNWENAALSLMADSDAHIVRGLVAIVVEIFSGKTAENILSIDMEDAFAQMGLDAHLSPSRRNGFFSMIEVIKASAQSQL